MARTYICFMDYFVLYKLGNANEVVGATNRMHRMIVINNGNRTKYDNNEGEEQ